MWRQEYTNHVTGINKPLAGHGNGGYSYRSIRFFNSAKCFGKINLLGEWWVISKNLSYKPQVSSRITLNIDSEAMEFNGIIHVVNSSQTQPSSPSFSISKIFVEQFCNVY